MHLSLNHTFDLQHGHIFKYLQNAGTHTSWIDVNCLLRLHFKGNPLLPKTSVVRVETKVSSDGSNTAHQTCLWFRICYCNCVCRSAASAWLLHLPALDVCNSMTKLVMSVTPCAHWCCCFVHICVLHTFVYACLHHKAASHICTRAAQCCLKCLQCIPCMYCSACM